MQKVRLSKLQPDDLFSFTDSHNIKYRVIRHLSETSKTSVLCVNFYRFFIIPSDTNVFIK